jgi:signal transduction histidine kinase
VTVEPGTAADAAGRSVPSATAASGRARESASRPAASSGPTAEPTPGSTRPAASIPSGSPLRPAAGSAPAAAEVTPGWTPAPTKRPAAEQAPPATTRPAAEQSPPATTRPAAEQAPPATTRPAARSAGGATAAPEDGRLPGGGDAWLTTVNILIGLWTGLLSFVFLGWLLPLSLALTPIFMVGVPLLALALALCRWFAALERARYRLVLGVEIPPPDPVGKPAGSLVERFRALVRTPARWREAGYHLLRFPLSAVQVVLITAVWLLPLGGLSLPIYNWSLPHGGANLGLFTVRTWWSLALVFLVSLALLVNSPRMVRWLGIADLAVARRLLGPDRLAARVGELERSRAAVVVSAEEERRRIERDLHDGAQQRLVALAMQLGRARSRFGSDPDGARALLDEAHSEAKLALAELRDLARGLHPAVLTDRGLDAALSGLAARSPIPVVVEVDPAAGAQSVPVVDAIAYFVVAEALTNVAKHAQATRAAVVVRRLDGMLRVVVTDDGVGGADPAGGTGLRGLADRVSGVDGRLHVDSPSGGPTVLTVELPCAS